MRKIPGWALVLAVGVVLILPRLGSFGLWDPYEIKFADAARDIAQGRVIPGGHPALQTLLAALSVKIFGTSELAGRLPSALCGLLGMLAVYYAASGLFNRRAALIAAIVVAVTPVYILESRSMASDVAAAGALALALGGLGRWVIERKPIHLAAGIAGVTLAALGAGYLIGVVAPCVALLAAGLLAAPEDRRDAAWRSLIGLGGAIVGAVLVGLSLRWMLHGLIKEPVPGLLQKGAVAMAQSFWGGIVHKGPAQFTFEEPVKLVGFGFFPASVMVPLALGGFVTQTAGADQRRSWARLFVLAFAATVFIGYELHCDRVSTELRFPGVGVLAVLVGAFADDLLGEESAHPLIAAALGIGVLLLVRDFALFPEDFAAAHIHDAVRWPAEIKVGVPIALLALVIAGALAAALARKSLTWRRNVLGVALGGAVALALYNAQVATPAFSDHVSFKSVFDHYRKLPKGALRAYHVVGRGLDYYAGGKLEEVTSPDQLTSYLKSASGGCAYAIIPNEELGGLDQQIRGAQVPYYVVDRSSSRFYLLASCLPAGERDVNPLRNYVETQPPNPPPKRIVHANFEDKVELLGVDLPDHVSRLKDGKFTVTLYFHVKDKVPAGYKIFLHFDGCGNRFNGDHLPVDGRFGTQFWSAGDYITDRFVVPAPLMTTPSCRYEALMGFFLGDTRLKLTPGSAAEANATNRVPLGPIQVD
jgi:4-amino-4-deoxy-L-arabinose transferase-like glycosyltransferase